MVGYETQRRHVALPLSPALRPPAGHQGPAEQSKWPLQPLQMPQRQRRLQSLQPRVAHACEEGGNPAGAVVGTLHGAPCSAMHAQAAATPAPGASEVQAPADIPPERPVQAPSRQPGTGSWPGWRHQLPGSRTLGTGRQTRWRQGRTSPRCLAAAGRARMPAACTGVGQGAGSVTICRLLAEAVGWAFGDSPSCRVGRAALHCMPRRVAGLPGASTAAQLPRQALTHAQRQQRIGR